MTDARRVPFCYLRTINGKPDWSEDCVGTKAGETLRGYECEDGYAEVPLYDAPEPEAGRCGRWEKRGNVHADCAYVCMEADAGREWSAEDRFDLASVIARLSDADLGMISQIMESGPGKGGHWPTYLYAAGKRAGLAASAPQAPAADYPPTPAPGFGSGDLELRHEASQTQDGDQDSGQISLHAQGIEASGHAGAKDTRHDPRDMTAPDVAALVASLRDAIKNANKAAGEHGTLGYLLREASQAAAALQAMERERDEAQKILRMMFTSGEVDVAKVALKVEARVAELNHFAQGQVELVAIVAGERDKLRELLRRKWEDDSIDIRPSTIDAALGPG